MSSRGFQFTIDIPFSPRWQHVDLLRTCILNCVATIFESFDFCDKLGMVTAELVENAINYGNWHSTDPGQFRLNVIGDPESVRVVVANPVRGDADCVSSLIKMLQRVQDAPSAKQAYIERLREVATKPEDGRSGLGLLRIAYETECVLRADLSDTHLEVSATIPSTKTWSVHPQTQEDAP